ncbi:MAG: hypothetical protein FDZ70_11115, partial [Actinobacteria bacterium]
MGVSARGPDRARDGRRGRGPVASGARELRLSRAAPGRRARRLAERRAGRHRADVRVGAQGPHAVTRRPVLVVDGYNVVHAAEPYSSLAARDLDAARTALVGDVASYAQGMWRGDGWLFYTPYAPRPEGGAGREAGWAPAK